MKINFFRRMQCGPIVFEGPFLKQNGRQSFFRSSGVASIDNARIWHSCSGYLTPTQVKKYDFHRGVEIGQNLFSGACEFSEFFTNLTNLANLLGIFRFFCEFSEFIRIYYEFSEFISN
jgi:uncharacterized protein YbcV (DUF1398 family)